MAARSGKNNSDAIKRAQALIARQQRELERASARAEKEIRADIRKFKKLGLFAKSFDESKPLTKYAKSKAKRIKRSLEEMKQEDTFLQQKGVRLQKHHKYELQVREKTRNLKPLKGGFEILETITEVSQLPYLEKKLKEGAYDLQKTPSEMLAFRIEDDYASKRIFHTSESLMEYLLYGNSEKYNRDSDGSMRDKLYSGEIEKIEIIRVANHNTSWDIWNAEKEKLREERKEMSKAFRKHMREKAKAENPSQAKSLDATNKERQKRYRDTNREKVREYDKERKRKSRAK